MPHASGDKFSNFLWDHRLDITKFYLSSWESIDLPKHVEVCGLQNLKFFNRDLCTNACSDVCLWNKVAKNIYTISLTLLLWIREPMKNYHSASIIWNRFMRMYPIMSRFFSWKTRNESHIFLGIEPIVGTFGEFSLSVELLFEIHKRKWMVLSESK